METEERKTGRHEREEPKEEEEKEEQTKTKQKERSARQERARGERVQWLKRPFVQQFVDAVADLPQRESVLLSVPVQLSQELPVGKMVENVIDARV